MALIDVFVVLGIVALMVGGIVRVLFPPKPTSPRYAEADSLLRELHVIDDLLNVLPTEFRDKLNDYLGGK